MVLAYHLVYFLQLYLTLTKSKHFRRATERIARNYDLFCRSIKSTDPSLPPFYTKNANTYESSGIVASPVLPCRLSTASSR
jgi:hypothetical protein